MGCPLRFAAGGWAKEAAHDAGKLGPCEVRRENWESGLNVKLLSHGG